jgi:branched-chain amino acid transport system substrate-binding protein
MKLKVIAAVAMVGLLSATWGGPSSEAATSGNTTGVSATEIKVSALGYKAAYGESLIGAQARFKRANDAGGVYGRKVVLADFNDDNQTPATDVQIVRKIVEQDKPFAIVPVLTATFPAAAYLNAQGVPFVGWGIVPDWCKKAAGFSLTGCIDPTINTTVTDSGPVVSKAFADGSARGTAVAILTADSDGGKQMRSLNDTWAYNGAEVVFAAHSVPIAPTVVSDYTPYATQLLTSNGGKQPDLINAALDTIGASSLYKKLKELGYKGKFLTYAVYDPRIASLSDGIYNEITFAPWEQTKTPAVAQMIKDVNAIDTKSPRSLAMAAGYWSADLFLQLLKKAGKNLTRERFISAGNKKFSFNGQGGTANLQFPASHTEAAGGLALVAGNGKGYDVTAPFAALASIPKAKYRKQVAADKKAQKAK